ncbi:MAG: enoyl-CoA hydratase-related protein, partial [Rhizobiaceae bacterium]|nr:enoyl-CoA hydratase-related protein [Rhizobiaceae bacterium]
VLDLGNGQWRARDNKILPLALQAERHGIAQLVRGEDRLNKYCWRVLARILSYASSLLPFVTGSPQDIDDAMKLGYNWVRGPFEMIDELGVGWFVAQLKKDGREVPEYLAECGEEPIYKVVDGELMVRHWGGEYLPVRLPQGVVRFHMMRRTLRAVLENDSASLFHLDDGIRLVEFHSKANALDGDSMAVVAQAACDPGRGILVHNDGQNFSAGVNLGHFLKLINQEDWQGIDDFLKVFQSAVSSLLYCNVPVVGAPSGLAIGGGFEILAHCDRVIAHATSVMGLVEATVGLVPGGGGVKETYWRWYRRLGDWEKAAWKTFNQIGYSQIGTSPALSAELAYFVPGHDQETSNRDRLFSTAKTALHKMQNDYAPRVPPVFFLAGGGTYVQMMEFLEKGKEKGLFLAHDVTVASSVASIVCGEGDCKKLQVSEKEMFGFERKHFIRLAKTPQTRLRIESMLSGNGVIRN